MVAAEPHALPAVLIRELPEPPLPPLVPVGRSQKPQGKATSQS